jgi:tetratricopeptide (TPR) repeat protein
MAQAIAYGIVLLVAAGAYQGITRVHQMYHSWWLTVYLGLCIALPVVVSAWGLSQGRPGFKAFVRVLVSAALGLVVLTLVYQHLTQNWIWACLAGMVIPGFVTLLQGWKTAQARLTLNQAIEHYNQNRYRDALAMAQAALNMAVGRSDRDMQAEAELMVGASYAHSGEGVRAARYLNRARPYLLAKKQQDKVNLADNLLDQLRGAGVDVEASAVADGEAVIEPARVDWAFVLNAVLSVAAPLALIRLWGFEAVQMTVPAAAFTGAFIFLLVFGGYAVIDLVRDRTDGARVLPKLLLFVLALVAAGGGALGLILTRGGIQAADFPAGVRGALGQVVGTVAGWPGWALPAILGVAVLAGILVVIAASGRSVLGFVQVLTKGDTQRRALELARIHLDAGEWTKAILQLNRIDLETEKNIDRRKETLFGLGFAHHKAGHPAEAAEYVRELLEHDPAHKEGLFLGGYMALSAEKPDLGQAERCFRRLYDMAPGYHPPGGRAGRGTARYYLCLALYRRAMGLMAQDVEAGAEALGEVGRIGALDKEVADALVRVHLYRFVQLVRRGDWAGGAGEAELAQRKLEHLEGLAEDPKEIAKIRGYCWAARGLVALQRGAYAEAAEHFEKGLQAVESMRRRAAFAGGGNSLLEQLLRQLVEGEADARTIHPGFPRDLCFLAAMARLRRLQETPGKAAEAAKAMAAVQKLLEESLAAAPDFVEGRALLGLVYCYLGDDDDIREKGVEALQSVRERVASKFVSQTLSEYEAEKERLQDAREAYFTLLQQYLQSADVPRNERQKLQDAVVQRMKERGLYETFMGKGGLEIHTEEEPTVQEYTNRAGVLNAKIQKVLESKRASAQSPQIQELMGRLTEQNQALESAVKSITDLEMKILQEALGIM